MHLELRQPSAEAPKLPRAGCSRVFAIAACAVVLMCLWSVVVAVGLSRRADEAPLPAALKRFLHLQRNPLPLHGVTHASLAAAFPAWNADDAFASDVALSLSLIVERLAARAD